MPKGTGQQLPSTPKATAPDLDSTLIESRLVGDISARAAWVIRMLNMATVLGTREMETSYCSAGSFSSRTEASALGPHQR